MGKEEKAPEKVKLLTETTQKTITDTSLQREVIELIEKVVIYKFPKKSNKELDAIFGLAEWKQTQFYQDVKAEGKLEGKLEKELETIPRLLKLGLTIEQIAEALELPQETVRQAIDNS